jgi:putative PEP-CTERM system TPR-repeat lipoprotein
MKCFPGASLLKASLAALLLLAMTNVVSPIAVAAIETGGASSGHLEKAVVLFDQGQYRAAVIELKNALQRDRGNLPARLLLGESWLKLDDYNAAIAEFTTARAEGANDNLVLLPLTRAYLYSGDYEKVIEEVSLVGQSKVSRFGLLVNRGHAYLELGNYLGADEDFETAIALDARRVDPVVGKSVVAFKRGDIDLSLALLEEAFSIDATDATLWYTKGEVLRARGLTALAVDHFHQAIAREPNHYKARSSLAALMIDSGKLDIAQDNLEVLKAIRQKDPQVLYLEALVQVKRGDLGAAEGKLSEALGAIDERHAASQKEQPQYLLLSAIIHMRSGSLELAYRQLTQYVEMAPGDPVGRKLYGRVLFMIGDPARARLVLVPVLRITPDDVELLALIGSIEMQLGNYTSAMERLERSVELAPGREDLNLQVARVSLRSGKPDLARQRLQAALTINPDSLEASYLLATLQMANGDFEGALVVADNMIRSAPQNPTGLNTRGVVLLRMSRTEEATTAFEGAQKISPGFFSAAHNLAQLDLAAGKTAEARLRYEALLEIDGQDMRAMAELADIAWSASEADEAIQRYEKIRSRSPGAWKTWMILSEIYLSKGEIQEARLIVDHLERLAPKDVAVLISIGRVNFAANSLEAADLAFGRAAVYAGGNAGQLREIAKYQIAIGSKASALKTLMAALVAAPAHLPTHATLVALLANEGDVDQAFAHAGKVTKAFSQNSLGPLLTGDIHMLLEDHAKAVKAFEAGFKIQRTPALAVRLYKARMANASSLDDRRRAVARLQAFASATPSNTVVLRTLASGLSKIGAFEKAMGLNRALIEENPNDAVALNNLANLLVRTEDPEALALAERAYALAPEQASVLDTLGWVLIHQGRPQDALQFLREARVRAGAVPEIHYHLALALSALGREAEALRELELALASGKSFDAKADAETLLSKLRGQ